MNLVQSLILGIVEGLTEFLPVSSTFHLILFSQIIGVAQSDYLKMFEVVIQFGAVLSLILLFAKTLLTNRHLTLLLLTSFLPTAIIGGLLYHTIKSIFFTNFTLQIVVFIIVALLILIIEYFVKNNTLSLSRNLTNISYGQASLIGLFQALSVIPGVSRSGSILLGMMTLGYTRSASASYAFLLSIPTIAAASLLDLYQNRLLLLSSSYLWQPLMVGFLAAFISSLLVVKWFTKYLAHHNLTIFAYYRLLLAIILLQL